MKKLILFCLILGACNSIKRTPPKFAAGDMVLTKFGDTVLILEAPTCNCKSMSGRYLVETRTYRETRALEAELSEKLVP